MNVLSQELPLLEYGYTSGGASKVHEPFSSKTMSKNQSMTPCVSILHMLMSHSLPRRSGGENYHLFATSCNNQQYGHRWFLFTTQKWQPWDLNNQDVCNPFGNEKTCLPLRAIVPCLISFVITILIIHFVLQSLSLARSTFCCNLHTHSPPAQWLSLTGCSY